MHQANVLILVTLSCIKKRSSALVRLNAIPAINTGGLLPVLLGVLSSPNYCAVSRRQNGQVYHYEDRRIGADGQSSDPVAKHHSGDCEDNILGYQPGLAHQ